MRPKNFKAITSRVAEIIDDIYWVCSASDILPPTYPYSPATRDLAVVNTSVVKLLSNEECEWSALLAVCYIVDGVKEVVSIELNFGEVTGMDFCSAFNNTVAEILNVDDSYSETNPDVKLNRNTFHNYAVFFSPSRRFVFDAMEDDIMKIASKDEVKKVELKDVKLLQLPVLLKPFLF